MFKLNKGILYKGEDRITWKLSWWELMETKWYHWVKGKQEIWDLRENIDELCNDSNIIFYLSDLTLDEIREFKDKLIWNEAFWNRVKHREELKKDFKKEFEECEEKYYDWDNEENRYPTDTGDYRF